MPETAVSQRRLSSGLPATSVPSFQSVGQPTPNSTKTSAPKRLPKKFVFPICLEQVEDASSKKKGHDLVFCDGVCQDWLHRQCAGLSKASFSSVKSSSEPFHCPRCLISHQSSEIASLKESMKQLSSEVSNLKAMVLSICNKVPQAECPSTTPPAAADCSHSAPPPASSRHRSNPA